MNASGISGGNQFSDGFQERRGGLVVVVVDVAMVNIWRNCGRIVRWVGGNGCMVSAVKEDMNDLVGRWIYC